MGTQTELADHASVGDVRGRGLFLGLEIVHDRGSREPHPELVEVLGPLHR